MKTRQGLDVVMCSNAYPTVNIPGGVLECSDYKSATDRSQDEYEKIAWVLEVTKTRDGRQMGFRPPKKKDYSHEEEEE